MCTVHMYTKRARTHLGAPVRVSLSFRPLLLAEEEEDAASRVSPLEGDALLPASHD